MTEGSRIVVIGIGNSDRGDDAFGRVVATRLRGRLPVRVPLLGRHGEATELLEDLAEVDAAILIDATVSGNVPGLIRRFDVAREPLPAAKYGLSTHGLGLSEAIEFARVLGQLPARCVVYAVEALSFEHGAPLSVELERVVEGVAELVLAEAAQWSLADA